MKKLIVLVSISALMLVPCSASTIATGEFENQGSDTLGVIMSSELSGLVNKWISVYSEENPDIFIRQQKIDEGAPYDVGQKGMIGIVTEDYLQSRKRGTLWSMVVARDVIVPVISADNPFRDEIISSGISPGQFAGIYSEPGKLSWGKVLGTGDETTVNCYCLGDESVRYCLSQFLQADNLTGNVTRLDDNSELINRIQNDKYSIGFVRLSGIIDYDDYSIKDGLQIVPVDLNANGILDNNENIYTCLNDFSRGVWIGKYPGSLCRNIHAVSTSAPVNGNNIDFLRWVLSSGQDYISEAGFSELIPGERQPKIQALVSQEITTVERREPVNTARIFFIIITVLLAGTLIFVITKLVRSSDNTQEPAYIDDEKAFNEEVISIPKGLFYDKSHTWAFMEKDGKVRIGIDDFLQHVTGKLTNIKMKAPGTTIKKGDVVVSLVQQGKQLDIYSPVSGVISENNTDLAVNSSIINRAPYSEGWVYIVEPENWLKETRKYLMAADYRDWIKNEFSRLKDFIAKGAKSGDLDYSQLVLQDGGEVKDMPLEKFGPDVWEDFQRDFIDKNS